MRKDLENNIKSRIGEIRLMKCGEECEIVEYRNANDIVVRFIKTGELVESRYSKFKTGNIRSHFTPSVFGIGIVGLETIVDEDGKPIKSYTRWVSMLTRCYDNREHNRFPRYKGCEICKEWLYYPNFKKWYEENYYEVDDEKMCLDKDILNKGNKVYSPDNCVFVPERINTLFVKSNTIRGKYPIGVCWKEKNKKFEAKCSVFDTITNKKKCKYLGLHNTPEEAFKVYKQFKENHVKQVADYYKDQIPKKLYNAMYRYEVYIDD